MVSTCHTILEVTTIVCNKRTEIYPTIYKDCPKQNNRAKATPKAAITSCTCPSVTLLRRNGPFLTDRKTWCVLPVEPPASSGMVRRCFPGKSQHRYLSRNPPWAGPQWRCKVGWASRALKMPLASWLSLPPERVLQGLSSSSQECWGGELLNCCCWAQRSRVAAGAAGLPAKAPE